MISLITPTIRNAGLPIVLKALKRQTIQDFEWLIGSPEKPDLDYPFIWVEDTFKDGIWSLNRIYNKLIKESKSELIVSWHDWTYANPDCLEKFLTHFEQEPDALVSATGDKYESEDWLVKNWSDPRTQEGLTYFDCPWGAIEMNLCSIPRKAYYSVGGYDEKLDFLGYGLDCYSVQNRLAIQGGWKFKLDQTMGSKSLGHGRVEKWDENNLMTNGKYQERAKLYVANPVLDYLK